MSRDFLEEEKIIDLQNELNELYDSIDSISMKKKITRIVEIEIELEKNSNI